MAKRGYDMPDPTDSNSLASLLRAGGVVAWNSWRGANQFITINIVGVDLSAADLRGADFRGAILSESNLSRANLDRAECFAARFTKCDLTEATFKNARLRQSNFRDAVLVGTDFTDANLESSHLLGSNLTRAVLHRSRLHFALLSASLLRSADLTEASLCGASFVGADLTDAVFVRNQVWGISAWDIRGKPRIEQDLLVTIPGDTRRPPIHVDELEMALFTYQVARREGQRKIFRTMAEKTVLVLGRFGDEGLELLYAIADWLRKRGYLPMIFDFARPQDRTLTETVQTLAGLCRFSIVDCSGRTVPHELAVTVPFHKIPYIPILERGREKWAAAQDILEHSWVLDPIAEFADKSELFEKLEAKVVEAEKRIKFRRADLKTRYGD